MYSTYKRSLTEVEKLCKFLALFNYWMTDLCAIGLLVAIFTCTRRNEPVGKPMHRPGSDHL